VQAQDATRRTPRGICISSWHVRMPSPLSSWTLVISSSSPGAIETQAKGTNPRRADRGHVRGHDAPRRADGGPLRDLEPPRARLFAYRRRYLHHDRCSGRDGGHLSRRINSGGQVVGDFQGADGKVRGFLRTSGGTFTVFDAPAWNENNALGINEAGQIVGDFVDTRGHSHGYVRTLGGAFTTIDVPGATNTVASAINSAGQIVGVFLDASGGGHSFVRTSQGIFIMIDSARAINTRNGINANGINDAGEIVGTLGPHGFLMR